MHTCAVLIADGLNSAAQVLLTSRLVKQECVVALLHIIALACFLRHDTDMTTRIYAHDAADADAAANDADGVM